MIKKLLKFGVLYLVMLLINNMIFINNPKYQQRPADFPQYVMNPSAYQWHPYNELALYKSPLPLAEAKEAKLVIHKKRISSPVERNKKFIELMSSLENPDGDPTVINQFGYMGKFQMGSQAFREVGVKMTPRKWKRNPLSEREQDELFLKFCAVNNRYLENDIKKYSGKRINGIYIHKANILGAAHGGIGRAHRFLASNGRIDSKDGNGTRISSYFRKFESESLDLTNFEGKGK